MQNLPPTVSTTLMLAVNVIRIRDWTTGTMEAPSGKVCVVGAIEKAVADWHIADPVVANNLVTDAINALNRAIWAQPEGKEMPHASAWNDRLCGSAARAIEMLRIAAGHSAR